MCAGRVTIFSTGSKFHPVSNLTPSHALTLAARSYALLNYYMHIILYSTVEEITPEQSSLSLTTSLKLFITQMHDRGFGLIGPRQVHAEYKMHTCKTIYTLVQHGV